jgi:hypothetical protein
VSAQGYPYFFNIVENAIAEVNDIFSYNRLVLSLDSEDSSLEEKLTEIQEFLGEYQCRVEIFIIIQHFCLETWALANKVAIPALPRSHNLREFKALFDVRINDPELLPPNDLRLWNRAQFAERYLRAALNDRNKNFTYTKSNPKALMHPKYFSRIKQRYLGTSHIRSFLYFISAFEEQ